MCEFPTLRLIGAAYQECRMQTVKPTLCIVFIDEFVGRYQQRDEGVAILSAIREFR